MRSWSRPAVDLDAVLANGKWDGVIHFASLSLVAESMRNRMRYMIENVGYGSGLIDACVRHGIERFVLSSTAALFGRPSGALIGEGEVKDPASASGESKLMLERALFWAGRVHGLRSACLRYFNAAGSDPQGRLGEHHDSESHLIPLVIDAALGRRPEVTVFGTDYDTPDGTGIRDYIHVSDLADAHLLAFDRLDSGSVAYNLGTGRGHSVMQVIRTVERLSGRAVPFELAGRREGDPAVLVANPARVRAETGSSPRYAELDAIVGTALAWREAHPAGYGIALGPPGRVIAVGRAAPPHVRPRRCAA